MVQRMVHQLILPPLTEEFRNHKMIPFVLPLVLLVAEDCTLTEYSDLVLPILAPAMSLHEPIQVRSGKRPAEELDGSFGG